MNSINKFCGQLFVLAGFYIGSTLLHAQEITFQADSVNDIRTILQAIEATIPLPADAVTNGSNFYSAQHSPDSAEPWPPLPADVLGLPVWPLGDGFYLLDDLDVDYDALALANAMKPLNGGGAFQPLAFTTNDLWLQITGETNSTAYLVLHPPWNVTNGVYDLLYCTNLVLPISWQWVLRTDPGQTNLIVNNATDVQGFYRLGPPNDLIANDSLGTNFWVAFMYMDDDNFAYLSLYISSPVGATGMMSIPGLFTNDSIMIATNCGDAVVNGNYFLTNLSAQEQMDWDNSGLDSTGASYAKGTNWVNFVDGEWYMFEYDPGTGDFTWLYNKLGINLNGSGTDWKTIGDPYMSPTTLCTQHPFNESFSVGAGAVTNLALDDRVMISSNDVIGTNGIHITTSQPVSVYALNYDQHGSAAFTCYPTPLLGINYCLLARPAFSQGQSEFAIVATADATTVTITPSSNAHLTGSRWTNSFMLQQGQTYQITSEDKTNDVTGTLVESDKPIGVLAGASLAWVPDESTGFGNPLVQEQLPVESWGTQALAIGFAGRLNGDSYRILSAFNYTIVLTNGVVAGTNQAGGFLDLTNVGSVEFQASQPIQVAEFANGNDFDGALGDPCELLLPSTGHYLETNIVFTLPNDDVIGDFPVNYINIIGTLSVISNTLVDGSSVLATNFSAIGASGYYGGQITVTNSGKHIITSSQPVGVQVYGWGDTDAYGYFGGIVK